MPFTSHCLLNFTTNCYLYIVKIEIFHPLLTPLGRDAFRATGDREDDGSKGPIKDVGSEEHF